MTPPASRASWSGADASAASCPGECLRLQGFDEGQIDRLLAITSDSQAYRQAGNSVTVNVIEAIGRRIRAVDEELRKDKAA